MKLIKLNKKILLINIIVFMTFSLALIVRVTKASLSIEKVTTSYHILVDVEESKMYILQNRKLYKNI